MRVGATSVVYTLRYGEEEVMRRMANIGYDSVDFNLYSFCGKDHHSKDYFPMAEDNWRDWAAEVKEHAKHAGIAIGQAHAPQFCMMPQDGSYREPEEIFYRCIEACAIMGVPHLVFHPIFFRARIKSEELLEEIMKYNIWWFSHLVPVAEKFGVKMALENSFDFPKCQLPGDPRYNFTTAEDMITLVDGLNSDICCFCLDTGHANISAQDVPGMVRAFGSRLEVLHLNDNYGMIGPIYSDIHTLLGFARVEFPEVLKALREVNYKGIYNMEIRASMDKMSDDVLDLTMKYAADAMRLYAKEQGIL
ncbi:MAG: sugar phosphate isomerase/epimerase [Clostridiales bacterium]|nr:sugar phosphate isomerase/epimerase [Clostridiales bacterium]